MKKKLFTLNSDGNHEVVDRTDPLENNSSRSVFLNEVSRARPEGGRQLTQNQYRGKHRARVKAPFRKNGLQSVVGRKTLCCGG